MAELPSDPELDELEALIEALEAGKADPSGAVAALQARIDQIGARALDVVDEDLPWEEKLAFLTKAALVMVMEQDLRARSSEDGEAKARAAESRRIFDCGLDELEQAKANGDREVLRRGVMTLRQVIWRTAS